jgi:hypothetical protein
VPEFPSISPGELRSRIALATAAHPPDGETLCDSPNGHERARARRNVAARGRLPNTLDVRISLLCSTLACASCGWLAGEVAEDKARQGALEEHVYTQDVDEIWSEARDLWGEFDCTLPETPKLDETFTCDKSTKRWFRMTAKSPGHVTAFEYERVDEHRDADGKTIVEKSRTREWDLEWRLLQEVDPDKAAEVDAAAKAKGEKAKKATKDLIEAFE